MAVATIWNNNCVKREEIIKFENVYEKKWKKYFLRRQEAVLLAVSIAHGVLSIYKILRKFKNFLVSMPSIWRGGASKMQCLGNLAIKF